MDDSTKSGLAQIWEIFSMTLCTRRFQRLIKLVFESQIEHEGSLKEKKLMYDFWLNAFRESRVRASKDHGKEFH